MRNLLNYQYMVTQQTTTEKDEKQKYIKLKRYAPFELAALYEVDRRTMNKWLKPFKEEIGPRQGLFYTIAQVRIIFNKLSIPGFVLIE